MRPRAIEHVTTSVVRAIATRGGAARALAVRMEALRSTGLRAGLTRIRQEGAFKRASTEIYAASHRAVWGSAADAAEATVEPLDSNRLRITRDGSSTTVEGRRVSLNDAAAVSRAEDKDLMHDLLAAAGLQASEQLAFDASRPAPAIDFMAAGDRPCVVKPRDVSGGGVGTTGGIRSRGDVLRASLRACRWSDRLLIERQLPGLVYRLLFLDGELLDTIERRPPELIGDGGSSVASLVARENAIRIADGDIVGSLIRLDLDAMLTLRDQGLTLRSAPESGRTFRVKSVTSQNARRDNSTYRGDLSRKLVEAARQAVDAVELRYAGVDLVTPDPTRSLEAAGGGIIEVNGEPGILHHYEVADPAAATQVAVPVLQRLLHG